MSALATVGLVAGREVRERFRGRALWVATGLGVVLAVLAVVLPGRFSASHRTRVGLVGTHTRTLGTDLVRAGGEFGLTIETSPVTDPLAARAGITGHVLDAAVINDAAGYRVVTLSAIDADLARAVRAAITAAHLEASLQEASVPASIIGEAVTPPSISYSSTQPADMSEPDLAGRTIAAISVAFLLMYGLGGWGNALASGVAQEKTSRTAEVLAAMVPIRQLLVGKVVGIGACGLLQVGLTVAAAGLANAATHAQYIPRTVWSLLPTTVLWFLLGYVAYAFAFAAAGALVARQEELQVVSTPLMLPLIAALLLAYAGPAKADTAWYVALSMLPPLAPILLPVRVALGPVPVWQWILAIALMTGTIVLVVGAASRVYAAALVRGGARVGWREARRSG